MILKLITVLCGPVLRFIYCSVGMESRTSVSCTAKANEKKATRPCKHKSHPKYPKSRYFCTNSMITQQKYLTGHECITMVPNSDHLTTHVLVEQTKTATVHSEDKQNGIYLYLLPKISITPTIKYPINKERCFPN